MLSIRHLSKRFGTLRAVDGVSLEVPAGRVHALLGPNGAGKTTTMRVIVGLLQPDAGAVEVDGHDVVRAGLAARRVLAYVPDEPWLYERLTAGEFLAFTARVYDLDQRVERERTTAAVERFHLGDLLDRPAEALSHGQRQRVVLAAAMLHAPRLLIVDEPLVGLDPKHIRIALDWFREVAREGGAVLMSTHTLATVHEVADTVSVFDHGRMVANGPVAEVAGDDLERRFLELTTSD